MTHKLDRLLYFNIVQTILRVAFAMNEEDCGETRDWLFRHKIQTQVDDADFDQWCSYDDLYNEAKKLQETELCLQKTNELLAAQVEENEKHEREYNELQELLKKKTMEWSITKDREARLEARMLDDWDKMEVMEEQIQELRKQLQEQKEYSDYLVDFMFTLMERNVELQ